MGNCCRREYSTMGWAGDDWGSLSSKKKLQDEKQMLLHDGVVVDECCRSSSASSSSLSYGMSGSVREVKIMMTKKELQELVGRLDQIRGFTLEQVLRAHLVNASDDHEHDYRRHYHEHQRSWRPALQSIPELNY